MKRVLLTLSVGITTISGGAAAEPVRYVAARQPSISAELAPNRKLVVVDETELEARASYDKVIAAADANRDGRVTAGELEGLVRTQVQRQLALRFHKLDRNGDGVVTSAEVPKMDRGRFERFDLDADGRFTLAELASVVQRQALARCRSVFARLDHDRDGSLTQLDADTTDLRVSKRDVTPAPAR